jgi:quinol monooxygenase YgiN
MYVRISRGHFDPERAEAIERLLQASGDTLIPAIKRLAGNLHYYAGIDRESGTMVNVSVWETLEQAQQMASLPEMAAQAQLFRGEGVRFDTIINYGTVWDIDG